MREKRFLLSDYWVEDEEFDIELENKCNEFVKEYFPNNIEDIGVIVDCHVTEDWKFEPYIRLVFEEFEYELESGYGGLESVDIYMSEHGEQFYLDNEWKMKYIYEYHTGSPIQKTEKIYGIKKDDIFRKFINCVLTV